ncbi:MAG: transcriptional repressor NrdR [Planctomycetes bacterium]|nr:transcriptional repressor NrdR [Planctomycetota bacterium]
MNCPFCKKDHDRVIDSRSSTDGHAIRRRRKCLACGRRFTTYERIESSPRLVVKKDGRREAFDREKILSGLRKACEKRPIPESKLEAIVERVEQVVFDNHDREVDASEIGERVMDELKQLDQVAYVRFASVYREFADVTQFVAELTPLLKKKETVDGSDPRGPKAR